MASKVYIWPRFHATALLILNCEFILVDVRYRLFCFDFRVFLDFVLEKMSELQVEDWKLKAQTVVRLCRKKCDRSVSLSLVSFINDQC